MGYTSKSEHTPDYLIENILNKVLNLYKTLNPSSDETKDYDRKVSIFESNQEEFSSNCFREEPENSGFNSREDDSIEPYIRKPKNNLLAQMGKFVNKITEGNITDEYESLQELKALKPEDTFSNKINDILRQKNLTNKEVYNGARLDRRLFSKILSNSEYNPSKDTVICLCIGMKLNLDEAEELLKTAGYSLSNSKLDDIATKYFLVNKIYDIYVFNEIINKLRSIN